MVRDLFINFCMLVTMATLGAAAASAQPDRPTTLMGRLRMWAIAVCAGLLLMQFPITLPGNVYVAFHTVPPALGGLYGGPGVGLLVALPLAAARALTGGPGSLPGALNMLVVGLLAGLLQTGGRGFSRPLQSLIARALLIHGLANLSLLLVPDFGLALFPSLWAPVSIIYAGGLITAVLVIRTRFESQQHLRTVTDLSLTDALTGLPNQRSFRQAVSALNQRGGNFLLLLDLDHFKRVNDQYGHLMGDQVLKETAAVLREAVRQSDVVSRYGGEEFAILLRSCAPMEAIEAANRIRQAVAEHEVAGAAESVRITISGGLVPLKGSADLQERFDQADRLLYEAKAAGRNRVISAVS